MPLPLALAANGPRSWIWWDWVGRHGDDIWFRVREHMELTAVAVGIGLLIAFPLSLLAHRRRRLLAPLLAATGILYTIPSLALFAFLIPYTGLSRTTAEIGLVSYTLLILTRNITTGLDGVPAEVREAATGMGFTSWRQLTRVELPLAVPTIVAGIRIAAVTTIGLVAVTALIGLGGLGSLIFNDGFNRDFKTPEVVGLVLSVALAIVVDLSLRLAERLLTPWSRGRAQ